MTTRRSTITLLLAVVLTAGGCTTSPPASAPTTDATATPSEVAIQAYERYWEVTEDAFAAPRARDWTAELEAVASGEALERALADYRTYRDFPAHSEGRVSRAPVVESTTGNRVLIVDCLDLGDSLLIADETGEVLDDLANRVQRYTVRAELVRNDAGWLVHRLDPALDEPC